MLKLKATAGTLAANATVPFTQVFNTNNKLTFDSNTISIKGPGFVEIEGAITVTATAAGAIVFDILVDDTAVSDITYNVVAAAIGDEITIPVYELFRVIPASLTSGFSKITIQTEDACTILNGVITAKYIR